MTGMTEPSAPAGPGLLAIDQSTAFGARAARHLREDPVVWLTTVSPRGAPSPNPVWFLWDGASSVTVFSLPDAARVAHLAGNPRMALHFGGDGRGGDIVVLSGTAVARPDAPGATQETERIHKKKTMNCGHRAKGAADGQPHRAHPPGTQPAPGRRVHALAVAHHRRVPVHHAARRRVRERVTMRLSLTSRVAFVVCLLLVLLFLYIPLVVVARLSFNPVESLSWPPRGWTLQWWRDTWNTEGPRTRCGTA